MTDTPEKCRIVKGSLVAKCEGMQATLDGRVLLVQTLRNFTTRKTRNRVVLKNHGARDPGTVFNFCPFCRANIKTEDAKPC